MGKIIQALMFLCVLLPSPANSQERGSKEWARQMKANAPLHQTKCEIESNEAMLANPHMDPFKFMERYGAIIFGPATPPASLSAYRDKESGVTFHVGGDGRYLTATDANGKNLWVRDPFLENNMCPYRSAHPYIAWIGPSDAGFGFSCLGTCKYKPDPRVNAKIVEELNGIISRGRKWPRPAKDARFIGLTFNSSQMGYVDIHSGQYYFMGQN